jgi:hypothetical protein
MNDTEEYLKYLCEGKELEFWSFLKKIYDSTKLYDLMFTYGTAKNFVEITYKNYLIAKELK